MTDDTSRARLCARWAFALAAVVLAVGALACRNRPFVDPPPGAEVKVTFFPAHGIAVSADTVLAVSAMTGRLVALRGDTVVVRLTRLTGPARPTAWAGREVTFVRDRGAKIEQTSFDRSKVGAVALGGMVWLLFKLFKSARY